MEKQRIKFYSADDLSTGWFMKEIEAFLRTWEESTTAIDINTVLELYNIKLYYDNGIIPQSWEETLISDFSYKCKKIPEIIGKYINSITNSTIQPLYSSVELRYRDDFWSVICEFKIYQRIEVQTIGLILSDDEFAVWKILEHKALSVFWGQLIANHLSENRLTGEKLISYYLEAENSRASALFFPSEFTQDQRDKVLWSYTERDDSNANYLQLLETAQSTKEFPVSEKLRLNARRKRKELSDKLLSRSVGLEYGAKVCFKSIPNGAFEVGRNNNIVSCVYSREWVEENLDFPTLLNNFIHLFNFVDRFFQCTFVSKPSEMGAIERHLGVKGRREYIKGMGFNQKHIISTLQVAAYIGELKKHDLELESIYKWFFEEYLVDEFNINGFFFTPSSPSTTYAEKCKLLAIAIDGVLKQYRLFCEEGCIDRELFEMSSGHIDLSSLPGGSKKKYAYVKSQELVSEMFFLFSDQSLMNHSRKTKDKYESLPQLLLAEKMKTDDFEPFNRSNLKWLINRGVVYMDEDEYLQINAARALVLKILYKNEVICPRYFDEDLCSIIDALVDSGDLSYGNTLFSKPEQDYLNYVLNKRSFSNGLDLRNKYCHDTYSLDEKQQMQDYFTLLKIMAIVIIKINEDLCLREEQSVYLEDT